MTLRVAGVDDAGRGPLGGPVVVAAVVFDAARPRIKGLDGSEQLCGQRYLPAYDMLDVRAGMDFGKVSVEVFGRNLTNDEGKTSDAFGNTPNGAISTGVIRPLSFGVTVTAEF